MNGKMLYVYPPLIAIKRNFSVKKNIKIIKKTMNKRLPRKDLEKQNSVRIFTG